MTNITELYWEASGVSLHTHRWAIETFGGSRNSVPERRGEDAVMPFRVGRTRVKKYRESRVLDLPMWIEPCNEDGSRDRSMTKVAKMHQNWHDLMEIFDTEDQFNLVKRFYLDGDIVVATAKAELYSPPEPSVSGGTNLRTTVSVSLADPYFYRSIGQQVIGNVTVQGTAPTDHVVITMGNGRVTNGDGNWIQYNGSGTAIIDCGDSTAKVGTRYVNGLIQRNPKFPEWMRLYPGDNDIQGSGLIRYGAAYK